MTKHLLFATAFGLLANVVQSQVPAKPLSGQPPALASIKESDLRRDLYAMSADHFKGRSAGMIDELAASVWCADQMRAVGLKPAGDNGTYFQFFSLWRNEVAANSVIQVGDRTYKLWQDVMLAQTAPANVTAIITILDKPSKAQIDAADLKGKAVAIRISDAGFNKNVSIPEWRYGGYLMREYGTAVLAKGAAAVIFITDPFGEQSWAQAAENYKRGTFDLEGGPNAILPAKAPVLWLHGGDSKELVEGATFKAQLFVNQYTLLW